ncbi:Rib43A-Like With Coiled-Coils Protein 1 [Manis pentadactyla]|nr:Rib43A-Like With Coiled-Coils Protein 1 [Manis pentadactyla]
MYGPESWGDSNRLWKEFPARFGNNNPQCGLSSLQCFSGEDLDRATCLRMQQEQFRCILEKQLQEQHQARVDEKCADVLRDQLHLAMDMQATQLAKREESCRMAMMSAMAKANKSQAAELTKWQHQEHLSKQETNHMEIQKPDHRQPPEIPQAELPEFVNLHQPTYSPILPPVLHQQPLSSGW